MALVKAQMSFYHDSVGTRAKDEMFEIQSEETVSQLEQAGYVTRVEGQALQAFQQAKTLEQQVGQRNALTNEAVSLASHEHNQQAAQHQQQISQMREQAGLAAVEAEIRRLEAAGETHRAEQLRLGLESQRQQIQQQQQQNNPNVTAESLSEQQKAMMETAQAANMNQAQTAGNQEVAQAEQAAANAKNATAKRANK